MHQLYILLSAEWYMTSMAGVAMRCLQTEEQKLEGVVVAFHSLRLTEKIFFLQSGDLTIG